MIITFGLGSLALLTYGLGNGLGHINFQVMRAIHEVTFVDKTGSEVSYEDTEKELRIKNK